MADGYWGFRRIVQRIVKKIKVEVEKNRLGWLFCLLMMGIVALQACTCDDCSSSNGWLCLRASCGCRCGRSMSIAWVIWVVQRGQSKRLVSGEMAGVTLVSLMMTERTVVMRRKRMTMAIFAREFCRPCEGLARCVGGLAS